MTEAKDCRSAWLCLALILAWGSPAAAPLTPLETKGKALYFSGIGGNGKPIRAYIGEESSAVDADAVPCVGCHGEDGRGRPEGGIVPTDLSWSYLTKPYGHRHGNYRQHPAFNERGLATAITRGLDPAGNPLDSSMPRFALSQTDLKALIAYLKRLDTDLIPGVDDTSLHIATVLPLSGPHEAVGRDMQALLQAYFAGINSSGGLYNRRLELDIVATEPKTEATVAKLRKRLDTEQVFAVLTPYAPGQEQALDALLEKAEVPYIAPLTDFPADDSRSGFFLIPGVTARARALLDHAQKHSVAQTLRLALVYPDQHGYHRAAARIASDATARGWPAPLEVAYAQSPGGPLPAADALLFLGSDDALATGAKQAQMGQQPPMLLYAGIPQGQITRDLPQPVLERLALTLPWSPDTVAPEAMDVFRGLQRKAGVGDRSLYPESWALAGAELLVQALKQSGRELSRRKFINALKSLHHVQAGPWPPLDFASSRHTGLDRVTVYVFDPKTQALRPAEPGNVTP